MMDELDAKFDESCKAIGAGIDRLQRDNAIMREALEFYANPEIYKPHPHGLAFDNRDLSFKARAVLEQQTRAA